MRPLSVIAAEIYHDWSHKQGGVNYAAKPYLEAMMELDNINQDYGCDSGRSVVAYFLSNARMWKGETARRIKKELKNLSRQGDTY